MDKISDDFYELELAVSALRKEADNFREKVKAEEWAGAFFASVRILDNAARIIRAATSLVQSAFNMHHAQGK